MLRTLLVFAVLIPGFAAALTSRSAALLLYVWIALFRPQDFIGLDGLRLSLVSGAILVVPALLSGAWPNLTHPLSVGGLLFLGSALAAQINAVNPEVGWYWLSFLGRLLLVCLLAVTLTNNRDRFVMLLTVIAASFGFHSAKAGLSSLLHGGSRFAEGLTGTFSDNNGYALGMVMTLWLLVAAGQFTKYAWLRRGLFLAALLTGYAVVSTFSRAGFLALIASTLAFLFLQRRRWVGMLIVGLALLAAPLIPVPEGYLDRVSTIQTYEKQGDSSALGRLHFWEVAVDMAIAKPLGVGLFNFEYQYDKFDTLDGRFGRRRSVHSSFFQVLAETGFFGAAVYCSMIAYSLVVLLRIRRRALTPGLDGSSSRLLEAAANALVASIVAFIVGGAFIALALNDLIWLLFALVASLDLLSREMCSATDTLAVLPATAHSSPATGVPSFAHFHANVLRRDRAASYSPAPFLNNHKG